MAKFWFYPFSAGFNPVWLVSSTSWWLVGKEPNWHSIESSMSNGSHWNTKQRESMFNENKAMLIECILMHTNWQQHALLINFNWISGFYVVALRSINWIDVLYGTWWNWESNSLITLIDLIQTISESCTEYKWSGYQLALGKSDHGFLWCSMFVKSVS